MGNTEIERRRPTIENGRFVERRNGLNIVDLPIEPHRIRAPDKKEEDY